MTERHGFDRNAPLKIQIADFYREEIRQGRLRIGERLLSTRTLARHWGVHYSTVHQALSALSVEGLLVKEHGRRVVSAQPAGNRKLGGPVIVKPGTVLVGGHPGSGKTMFANGLAALTGWPVLDADRTVSLLSNAITGDEAVLHACVTRTLLDVAETLAHSGTGAIVTAGFAEEFADSAWIAAAQNGFHLAGAGCEIVWLHSDQQSVQANLRLRGSSRDLRLLTDWDEGTGRLDFTFRPAAAHHLIDNTPGGKPLRDQVTEFAVGIHTGRFGAP